MAHNDAAAHEAARTRTDIPTLQNRLGSSREEIGTLITEHLRDLRAFSRSLTKERVMADDLVQEAIVKALTSAHHFELGTNFKAWMFTILRNSFYNEKRQASRFVAVGEPEEVAAALERDISDHPTQEQDGLLELVDFKRAFWQLSPDHREVLTLIGPGGLSYDEAARVCGCAIGTVKSRTNRARQELQRILASDKTAMSRRDVAAAAGTLHDGTTTVLDWLQHRDWQPAPDGRR